MSIKVMNINTLFLREHMCKKFQKYVKQALPNLPQILQKYLPILHSSKRCLAAIPHCPIVSYKRPKNLKDILVKIERNPSMDGKFDYLYEALKKERDAIVFLIKKSPAERSVSLILKSPCRLETLLTLQVLLTLSVLGYLTVILSWGGVLKTHSLKPDLTLSNHYANHTM